MPYTYTYTREIVNDKWDINNPVRVDEEGNQIYLAKEIESAIPEKRFKIFCEESVCDSEFQEELSGTEKTQLDVVVADHKSNTNL